MKENFLSYFNSPLKIVIVGHVDDGKSTLIGRMLFESEALPDEKIEELKSLSKKRGMQIEWSFLLDSFQAERNQAITIDTTQVNITIKDQKIILIDAPGHLEFLQSMITGAANSNAAILVIDAFAGIREQTYRHCYLLRMLGVSQVICVINKMDLIGYSEEKYKTLVQEIHTYLDSINLKISYSIPTCAREGDNISCISSKMNWYDGPTLFEALVKLPLYCLSSNNQSLRFPIQDIYKFDERRILVGRVESGTLKVGDKLIFFPSKQSAHIRSIENWGISSPKKVAVGQSIGITLEEQIFVERGYIATLEHHSYPQTTDIFQCKVLWLGQKPLRCHEKYKIKIGTQETIVVVQDILFKIDIKNLNTYDATSLEKNEFGVITLKSHDLILLDNHDEIPQISRCMLIEDYNIVGAGILSIEGYNKKGKSSLKRNQEKLVPFDHYVTLEEREKRAVHKGGVLWLTGLSASGKSTLSMNLEHLLFEKGYQVFTIDGDNIRNTLNSDLDFSREGRRQNVRRVAAVASLFSDAGFICIVSLISPYREDRASARAVIGNKRFHKIYIKSSLKTCISRDPKKLYEKANLGKISNFTGISATYEVPENADLVINTEELTINESVERILEYIFKNFKK